MTNAVIKVSPFDLPADSRAVEMLTEWKVAGGTLKELFRLSLLHYERTGKFDREIEELRSTKEDTDEREPGE